MGIVRNSSQFPNASFSETISIEGPGRWIYVSGEVGLAPGASSCEGDVASQTGLCFDRIEASLARQGAKLSDVIRLTVYMRDLDQYAEFSRVRAARFASALPASSGLEVSDLLLNAAVEIDAIAFVPAGPGKSSS